MNRFIYFFLITILFLASCGIKRSDKLSEKELYVADLDVIRGKGKIIAVVDYNSTNYFIYRGEPMGYQFDMLKEFATHLGIDLDILVENDLDKSFELLNSGSCDLIALNLTVTQKRKRLVNFSIPISQTRQVLVQRKPEDWRKIPLHEFEKRMIRNQLDLAGKTIYVQRNSSFSQRLYNLAEEIGDTIYIIEVNEEAEQLVKLVAQGEIDYTVCDENVARVNRTYYPVLDIETAVSFPQNLAWAVRKDGSDRLLANLNQWLKDYRYTAGFNMIYNKYFKNQKSKQIIKSDFYVLNSGKVSPWDEYLREFSDTLGWDWLLLASMIYQESRFIPDAHSWAGAFGLMQLMPNTAKQYGINRNSTPLENIEAGVKFIQWLGEVFEDKVSDEDEKTKFILGAYNVGLGHIFDARRLAMKHNQDPNNWDIIAEKLILKSNPEYYHDPVVRYGYCRGEEPVNYVREILDRYEHYKNIIHNDPVISVR